MFRVWLRLVLLWLVVLVFRVLGLVFLGVRLVGLVLLLGLGLGLGLRLVLIRPVLLGLVLVVLLWGVVCWVGCCLGFRWRGL